MHVNKFTTKKNAAIVKVEKIKTEVLMQIMRAWTIFVCSGKSLDSNKCLNVTLKTKIKPDML